MKEYVIKAGQNRSVWMPKMYFGKRNASVRVRFTESCLYDAGENQQDWSKLFGFGEGFNHHWNSNRWVWRPNLKTGLIEYGGYDYVEGKRWMPEDYGGFESVAIEKDLFLPPIQSFSWGMVLNPWLGGDFTLKYDVKILMDFR